MLTRVDDFLQFFEVDRNSAEMIERASDVYAARAGEMMHRNDYLALGSLLVHLKPENIFEIGTFLGVTSDFLLQLAPQAQVVSIAYVNSPKNSLDPRRYNNSHLPPELIGSEVSELRKKRFTQIIGDSHTLSNQEVVALHGRFDLVLIDGDHSSSGISSDTQLARELIKEDGVLCWHDANPKPKYEAVRQFLETKMPFHAVATTDDYIGGVAAWSQRIERTLRDTRKTTTK